VVSVQDVNCKHVTKLSVEISSSHDREVETEALKEGLPKSGGFARFKICGRQVRAPIDVGIDRVEESISLACGIFARSSQDDVTLDRILLLLDKPKNALRDIVRHDTRNSPFDRLIG